VLRRPSELGVKQRKTRPKRLEGNVSVHQTGVTEGIGCYDSFLSNRVRMSSIPSHAESRCAMSPVSEMERAGPFVGIHRQDTSTRQPSGTSISPTLQSQSRKEDPLPEPNCAAPCLFHARHSSRKRVFEAALFCFQFDCQILISEFLEKKGVIAYPLEGRPDYFMRIRLGSLDAFSRANFACPGDKARCAFFRAER